MGNELFEQRGEYSAGDHRRDFWQDVHRRLTLRHGRMQLCPGAMTPAEDAYVFLLSSTACPGPAFLDFLEDIFRVDCYWRLRRSDEEVVADLNVLLRADNLPYHVTEFVKEERVGPRPFGRAQGTYIETLAYQTVIMRESEVAHAEIVEPVLALLRDPRFKSASAEYLAALADYRKDDYGDCLTKCGSAYESVMKVICDAKGWPYDPRDTAAPLIARIRERANLGGYLEPGLLIAPVIRNRQSTSHGAGVDLRNPSRQLARYALHSAAAAILFLAAETGFDDKGR